MMSRGVKSGGVGSILLYIVGSGGGGGGGGAYYMGGESAKLAYAPPTMGNSV